MTGATLYQGAQFGWKGLTVAQEGKPTIFTASNFSRETQNVEFYVKFKNL